MLPDIRLCFPTMTYQFNYFVKNGKLFTESLIPKTVQNWIDFMSQFANLTEVVVTSENAVCADKISANVSDFAFSYYDISEANDNLTIPITDFGMSLYFFAWLQCQRI